MEMSLLHFHSQGRVSSIKERGSNLIYAIPTENRFSEREEVIAAPTREVVTFNTENGESNHTQVIDNSIPCYWLKLNTNRVTPPDVRRDDKVLIWRLGNTDRYFWMDFNEANVKRLETVVYAFSADPKNPIAPDLSNAYVLSFSSHDKHITLRTSQANGEPFGYTLQLDTGEGRFVVEDTAENQIFIDSPETIIGMVNAMKTSFLLDKKNILASAPDSIRMKATNTIAFSCKDFTIDASSSIKSNTKSYNINTDTFKMTCNSMTVEATSVKYNCPSNIFTGLVKAATIAIGGGGAKSGGGDDAASIVGNLKVEGGMKCTGKIECGEIVADKGTIASFSHSGPPCC